MALIRIIKKFTIGIYVSREAIVLQVSLIGRDTKVQYESNTSQPFSVLALLLLRRQICKPKRLESRRTWIFPMSISFRQPLTNQNSARLPCANILLNPYASRLKKKIRSSFLIPIGTKVQQGLTPAKRKGERERRVRKGNEICKKEKWR